MAVTIAIIGTIGEGHRVADIQLKVHELRKTFHPGLFEADVEALKGLSFEVGRGEIFGFLGPNGAGKTTTIKAITDLIRPDSGTIEVCGLPHTAAEAKRRVGFMSESPYVYSHLTGREYLRFCAELLGLERAGLEARIAAVLEEVGMASAADRGIGTYSKGMQQRITLAQALLGDPELLILDEPMSGLDPLGRRDVRDIILARAGAGATVFFSSHIIPDVEALCDRVAVVVDGAVRTVGSVEELVSREAVGYEITFTGVPAARLETPLASAHERSDATRVRVAAADREALLGELARHGAQLVSLNPVRAGLEELLLGAFEGGAS
jgi:ABC-2 type transport system ATP-binding protein